MQKIFIAMLMVMTCLISVGCSQDEAVKEPVAKVEKPVVNYDLVINNGRVMDP